MKDNQSSIGHIRKIAFKQESNLKVNTAALEAVELIIIQFHNEQIFGFIPFMFDVPKLLENTLNNGETQYILEIINQIAGNKALIFIKEPLIFCCNAILAQVQNISRALSLDVLLSLTEFALIISYYNK